MATGEFEFDYSKLKDALITLMGCSEWNEKEEVGCVIARFRNSRKQEVFVNSRQGNVFLVRYSHGYSTDIITVPDERMDILGCLDFLRLAFHTQNKLDFFDY